VFARDILVYWISLAFVIAITFAVYRFVKSSLGLALAAARDNPRAARSVGVRTNHIRHLLWIAIAAATGVVGAVIYLQKARLSPDAAFNVVDWTAYVLFIVVIGGIRTIEGPFVGVLVLWALVYFLSQYGPLYLLLLGAMAILTMLFLPGGVWGFVADRYNIQLFPTSRRLRFDPIDGAYPVRKKRSSGDEAVRPSSASD
jgi:branched-chain amino acid transport system permease protein